MIDFQDKSLKTSVYHVISKLCLLFNKKRRPSFQTKQMDDGTWSCSMAIPDFETISVEGLKTEIEAVNKCACEVDSALYRYEDDCDFYNPSSKRSNDKELFDIYFGEIEYSDEYAYKLYMEPIELEPEEKYLKDELMDLLPINFDLLEKNGEELYKISNQVYVTFLTRKKKKNYC